MKKREIIIFSILFILAAGSIAAMNLNDQQEKRIMLITIDGEEYKRVELTDDLNMEFTIETVHGENKVVVTDGVVDVVYADCPNQICVNTKAAEKIGDNIVCLPHKVVIEIIGEEYK